MTHRQPHRFPILPIRPGLNAARAALLAGTSLLALGLSQPLLAQDWQGDVSSDWFTPGNWDNDAVPTDADTVTIQTNAPAGEGAVIDGAAPGHGADGAEVNNLQLFDDTTLTIRNGGQLTTGFGSIGRDVGNVARLEVNGATSELTGDWIIVGSGEGSDGTLIIDAGAFETDRLSIGSGEGSAGRAQFVNGATVVINDFSTVGVAENATGVLEVSGVTTEVTMTGRLTVASSDQSTGFLVFTDGANVLSEDTVSLAPNGVADVTVAGGASWRIWDELVASSNGTSIIAVSSGGSITADTAILGRSSFGTAEMTVSGAGSRFDVAELGGLILGQFGDATLTYTDGATGEIDGQIRVGQGSGVTAALNVTAGASLETGEALVGVFPEDPGVSLPAAIGTVLVSGAGSAWDIQDSGGTGPLLSLAVSGIGNMTVADGGVVDVAGDAVIGRFADSTGYLAVTGPDSLFYTSTATILGDAAGSLGEALVSGAGAELQASTVLVIGRAGEGVVTVTDGGFVESDNGPATLGAEAGGRGTLTLATGGEAEVDGDLILGAVAGAEGTLNIGAAASDAPMQAGLLEADSVTFGGGTGTLVFNHTGTLADAHDFATDLVSGAAGTHAIDHLAGVTIYSGDGDDFAGTTTVSGGLLIVDGSLAGLTRADGGVIGGSGTLRNLVVGSGGTLAPGNSVGTLATTDASFAAGSVYEVELNDGGFAAGVNNDLLAATGTVTITGGTIHVTPENGTDTGDTYTPGTYTIITAGGGVTGSFDAVTDDFAFLDFSDDYDGNTVFLLSSIAAPDFCLAGFSANQCAVGGAVAGLGAGQPVFDATLGLSDTSAPGALDQLSGEIHAALPGGLLEDARFTREAAQDRLRGALGGLGPSGGQITAGSAEGLTVWGQVYGATGTREGTANSAAVDRSIGGVLFGADAAMGDGGLRWGVLAGTSRSRVDLDARTARATIDTTTLGLYAGGAWDGWRLTGGIAHGWHDIATTRSVDFPGFTDRLDAAYGARSLQLWAELAYRIAAGDMVLEPYAGLAHLSITTDAATETGGAAALDLRGGRSDLTLATLGLRGETALDGDGATMLRGMIGWQHAIGDTPVAQAAFGNGGPAFGVTSLSPVRDTLMVDIGLDVRLSDMASWHIGYGGRFGEGLSDHSGQIGLSIRF